MNRHQKTADMKKKFMANSLAISNLKANHLQKQILRRLDHNVRKSDRGKGFIKHPVNFNTFRVIKDITIIKIFTMQSKNL